MSYRRESVLLLARLAQWRVRLARTVLAALLGWTAWNVGAVIGWTFVYRRNVDPAAIWGGALWALACGMGALFVPCSAVRAAARIDRQRGLKERFATAVELAQSGRADSPAAEVVYTQATATVGRLRAVDSRVIRSVGRAAAGWALSMLLALSMCLVCVVPEGRARLSPDQRREAAAVLRSQAAAATDEELARKFEQAAGAVIELDDETFDRVMDELREAGFRPIELTSDALRAAGALMPEDAGDGDATADGGQANTQPGQPDIDEGSWARVYHPDYDAAGTAEGDGPPQAREADYAEVWPAAKLRATDALSSGKVPAEYRRIVQRYFSDTSSE